jgi:ubiquinone biosynthesis accessory factor UbiK
MIRQSSIEELTRRIAELLPPGTEELRQDVKKNVRAALTAAFARMDLVTREEFDVQAELLARTRMRLEAMEKQVAELEARLAGSPTPGT